MRSSFQRSIFIQNRTGGLPILCTWYVCTTEQSGVLGKCLIEKREIEREEDRQRERPVFRKYDKLPRLFFGQPFYRSLEKTSALKNKRSHAPLCELNAARCTHPCANSTLFTSYSYCKSKIKNLCQWKNTKKRYTSVFFCQFTVQNMNTSKSGYTVLW